MRLRRPERSKYFAHSCDGSTEKELTTEATEFHGNMPRPVALKEKFSVGGALMVKWTAYEKIITIRAK